MCIKRSAYLPPAKRQDIKSINAMYGHPRNQDKYP